MAKILGGGLFKQSPKKKIVIGIILISIVSILIMTEYTNPEQVKQPSPQESFFAI